MPTVTTAPADFAGLVSALFGDLVDADALYEVSKMGPDPSSVHTPGPLTPVRVRRRKVAKREPLTREERMRRAERKKQVERAGAAIGVASSAIGTKELVQGASQLRTRPRSAAYKMGAGSVLLAGDVLGTLALAENSKRPVEKAIPLPKVLKGRLTSVKRTLGFDKPPTAPAAPPVGTPSQVGQAQPPSVTQMKHNAAREAGRSNRQAVQDFIGTTTGKVAIGGAAGVGVYSHGKKKGYEQAVYGKVDDVAFGGAFSKFDNDKRQAFGWASVVEVNGEPVIDRQGDYIGIDDIEDAAYVYVRKSRVAGDMHRRTETDEPFKAGELIESVVFTKEKCQAMGLPMSCAGKWWIGVQVDDEDTWQEVKKQARTGFSIHGKGLRKDVDYDSLVSS